MERDEYGRAKRGRPQDFNSHAHVERDTRLVACAACQRNFNSHAHVERDADTSLNLVKYCYFNSHAHVERDVMPAWYVTQIRISTHTLTWSVTPRDVAHFANLKISTHTLTWSVTKKKTKQLLSPKFQLTRSRGA